MKLSISLPDDDVAYLDDAVESGTYASRSAAIARALRLLRSAELGDMYDLAFREWALSGDAEAWDATTAKDWT